MVGYSGLGTQDTHVSDHDHFKCKFMAMLIWLKWHELDVALVEMLINMFNHHLCSCDSPYSLDLLRLQVLTLAL